jgi:hypothetical protein
MPRSPETRPTHLGGVQQEFRDCHSLPRDTELKIPLTLAMSNFSAHAAFLAPNFSSTVASPATHAVLLAAYLLPDGYRLRRNYRKLATWNKVGQRKTRFLVFETL